MIYNDARMDFLVNLITHLSSTITDVISAVGYPGVFFFMVLESMVFPIPSELIMPFAGFLIAKGEMSFAFVVLASSLGSLVGSLLSYAMGKFGGEPLIRRYGKYFFVDSEDLIKRGNADLVFFVLTIRIEGSGDGSNSSKVRSYQCIPVIMEFGRFGDDWESACELSIKHHRTAGYNITNIEMNGTRIV